MRTILIIRDVARTPSAVNAFVRTARGALVACALLSTVATSAGAAPVDDGPHVAAASGTTSTWWTTPQLLRALFSSSERVTAVELTQAELQAALGHVERAGAATRGKYLVYAGWTGDRLDGLAVIDDERGQHEPIRFGVLVKDGVIARVEVMNYREAFGSEIRSPKFLQQLQGKSLRDAIHVGSDVDGISGATLSARASTVVARRALVLCDLAAKKLVSRSGT